jgi:hypothetical protein
MASPTFCFPAVFDSLLVLAPFCFESVAFVTDLWFQGTDSTPPSFCRRALPSPTCSPRSLASCRNRLQQVTFTRQHVPPRCDNRSFSPCQQRMVADGVFCHARRAAQLQRHYQRGAQVGSQTIFFCATHPSHHRPHSHVRSLFAHAVHSSAATSTSRHATTLWTWTDHGKPSNTSPSTLTFPSWCLCPSCVRLQRLRFSAGCGCRPACWAALCLIRTYYLRRKGIRRRNEIVDMRSALRDVQRPAAAAYAKSCSVLLEEKKQFCIQERAGLATACS